MLHRVIYASEAVGTMGASTLSIAQILGVSEPNNRRDHLSDTGVPTRRLESPITLCPDPATLLDRIGIPCLSGLSAPQAETMLKMSQAA